jgi:hypothetical protein
MKGEARPPEEKLQAAPGRVRDSLWLSGRWDELAALADERLRFMS